ncbi:hypothetical protein M1141_01830 [Candidatus Marsarchaeota archaeon]|nr:hypothetical protein [Candidatus Marsarchaeota archaeon]
MDENLTKYELLTDDSNTEKFCGFNVHRIRALIDIKNEKGLVIVKKGDLGGFVEDYHNLSQSGSAWIFDDAIVCNQAYLGDDARIFDEVVMSQHSSAVGSSKLYGETCLCGSIEVKDKEIWAPVQISSYEMLEQVLRMQNQEPMQLQDSDLKSKIRTDEKAADVKQDPKKMKAI